MVRSKPIIATLALIATTQASPIAHPQDSFGVDLSSDTKAEPTQSCNLKAFEPKSWKESGAEKFLGDWLNKNGSGKAANIVYHLELTLPSQIIGFKLSATPRWGLILLQLIVRTQAPTVVQLQWAQQTATNTNVRCTLIKIHCKV